MFLFFPRPHAAAWLALLLVAPMAGRGGDLKKNYFGTTTPGARAEYKVTSSGGAESAFRYERGADDDGHPVIELQVKVLSGPGKDSETKLRYFLPRNFNFERDGLNYGKSTEKMVMNAGGADMAVDAKTLETIRASEKDFRGAVTFEATEKIDGHSCDRYGYALKMGGPNPTQETGHLWLDPSVPFATVRQAARVVDNSGKLVTEFEMRLTGTGLNQAVASSAAIAVEAPRPAAPATVTLGEGFKKGRVGLEVEVVPGSAGRKLRLVFVNKTESSLTVTVPAGDLDLEADSPVNRLLLTAPKALQIALPENGRGEPLSFDQRGNRGLAEGHCTLSVYEGTPLFSGSVTMGNLPK